LPRRVNAWKVMASGNFINNSPKLANQMDMGYLLELSVCSSCTIKSEVRGWESCEWEVLMFLLHFSQVHWGNGWRRFSRLMSMLCGHD